MVGKGTNRKSMNHVEYMVAFIEYLGVHDNLPDCEFLNGNSGNNIKKTDFVLPVKLENRLKATIEYEFVHKTEEHVFLCE